MSKKDKSELDLDFSDIANAKIKSCKSVKAKEPKVKKKPQTRMGDIVLSIPDKTSASKFLNKTISECNPTDFVNWSKNVAYIPKDPLDHFEKEENRVNHFLKVLTFHRKNFLLANPEALKTFH